MTQSNKIFKFVMIILLFVLSIGLVACGESDKDLAKAFDDAVDQLPAVVTLADETKINEVKDQYDQLTAEQKELVTKYDALLAKLDDLADLKAADAVDQLISALPGNIVLANKAVVEAARAAYNALTDAQKELVTKLADLTAKETKISELEAEKLSQEQVQAVFDLIAALPETVTVDDETQIVAARTAFNALTAAQKSRVTNSNKLTIAESKLAEEKATAEDLANQAAAAEVVTLISALPETVEIANKDAVVAARTAYAALTEAQKAYVTNEDVLQAKELRIANLEAAKPVIDLIAALPETVATTDETAIVAARTAYAALTDAVKNFVTNLDTLVAKEKALEIAKNPDLAVLYPVIESVPSQIVNDYSFPTDSGKVTWTYKDGEDQSFFDLTNGLYLKNAYEVKEVVLQATFNNTTLDVTVNFGLVQQGQTPIFYVGGNAAAKPAGGPAWEGFGSYETQLNSTGFGGVMISAGQKVYYVSEGSYISLSGTTDNQLIDRAALRPYGLEGQDSVNNNGLVNGVPTGYAGTGTLYQNTGDYAITFYGCDTYGRVNAAFAGYGKVKFSPNQDGTYTVSEYIADHGGANDPGNAKGTIPDDLVITLQPGEFLWCPHTWDTDYSDAGFGSKLVGTVAAGALVKDSIITVTQYKDYSPSPDEVKMNNAISSIPEQIISDYKLPTTVTWAYKDGEDTSIYDLATGELMRFVVENTPVVVVATKGDITKEVTLNFGLINPNDTQWYYNASETNVATTGGTLDTQKALAGFGGVTIFVDNNQYFVGQNAFVPLSATEADTVITQAQLRPAGLEADVNYNIGLSKGVALGSNRGYGVLYYNSGSVTVKFDLSFTYGRNNAAAYGYGKIVFTPQEDGTYKVNEMLADTGTNTTTTTTPETMFTLNPGEYLWCPHTWETGGTQLNQQAASKTTGVLAIDKLIQVVQYKTEFPVQAVENLIAALPDTIALTDEAAIQAARDAYTALTSVQKGFVTNYAKLEASEVALAELNGLYGMTYILDGGVNNEANPAKYDINNLPLTLAAPTKEGYTFLGWYDNAEFTGDPITEVALASTGAKTVYAKWEITTYSVTYNLDGGIFGYATLDDMKVAFLTDLYNYIQPTDDLMTFMHGAGLTTGYNGTWINNADYKAKIYSINHPEEDANLAFFINQPAYNAKWLPFLNLMDKLVREVNPDQNFWGSTWTGLIRLGEYMKGSRFTEEQFARNPWGSAASFNILSNEITLGTPTKDGYTFSGWYSNAEFTGDAVTKIAAGSTGDVVLFAKWVANQA